MSTRVPKYSRLRRLRPFLFIIAIILLFRRRNSAPKPISTQHVLETSDLRNLAKQFHENHDEIEPETSLLSACARTPIYPLESFDPEEEEYLVANPTADRKHEPVWELILGQYIYFPAKEAARTLQDFGSGVGQDISDLRILSTRLQWSESKPENRGKEEDRELEHPRNLPEFLAVYRRLDRARGLQYVAHYSLPSGATATLLARLHLGEEGCMLNALAKPATNYKSMANTEENPHQDDHETQDDMIYILVAYTSRENRLRAVMHRFRKMRKTRPDLRIRLIIAVRRESPDVEVYRHLVAGVFGPGPGVEEKWGVYLVPSSPDAHGNFSKSLALRAAAEYTRDLKDGADATGSGGSDAILFVCDVDMDFSVEFFARCARNALPGRQAFFPVIYSLYAHADRTPSVGSQRGYWNGPGYGMVCMYAADFMRLDAFADGGTRFRGWGPEDKFLYDVVREDRDMVAFRALEPGLVHRWHWRVCEKHDWQSYKSCMGSNFLELGHPMRLGEAYDRLHPGEGLQNFSSDFDEPQW